MQHVRGREEVVTSDLRLNCSDAQSLQTIFWKFARGLAVDFRRKEMRLQAKI